MKLIFLLPAIILSFIYANNFSQGLNDADNTYCGKSSQNFPPPNVVCTNGNQPSLQCKEICYQSYVSTCIAASNKACNDFGSCTYAFGVCKTVAMDTYDNCMLLATTSSAIEACRTQLFADLSLCMEQYEVCKKQVKRDYDKSTADAKNDYEECVLECCGHH